MVIRAQPNNTPRDVNVKSHMWPPTAVIDQLRIIKLNIFSAKSQWINVLFIWPLWSDWLFQLWPIS